MIDGSALTKWGVLFFAAERSRRLEEEGSLDDAFCTGECSVIRYVVWLLLEGERRISLPKFFLVDQSKILEQITGLFGNQRDI